VECMDPLNYNFALAVCATCLMSIFEMNIVDNDLCREQTNAFNAP
jgi:hypothetical protein